MFGTVPPISVSNWLDQFNDDPLTPVEYKNGREGQLKVYDTSFNSGSVLNSTQNLHLRIICHKYLRIEALGDLMEDDGDGYIGFISAENMTKGREIFRITKPKRQNYLDELTVREIEEANLKRSIASHRTGNPRPGVIRLPCRSHPTMPSLANRDPFFGPLHHQLLITVPVSEDEPESLVEFGFDPPRTHAPLAVNQVMPPPSTPVRAARLATDTTMGSTSSTPDVFSYYPARGGRSNKPASDETHVNTALVDFLQAILSIVDGEFDNLNWLATRLAFKLTESVLKTDSDGQTFEETRELMEARVDGYLCRRDNPDDMELNNTALAIVEVKPCTLLSSLSAIRRQQGAELACWISQNPYTLVGLLQSSTSGRERRLMISQHRHEIYVTVAEYGPGFKKHIRPLRTFSQDSTEGDGADFGSSAPNSTTTERGSSPEADDSPRDVDSTPVRRNPALLAGSPSYVSRVERKGIEVAADPQGRSGKVQPTEPTPEMEDWPGTDPRWTPEPGDFLIMHEFGPFITKNPGHMEVFMKRFIAFCLQLRGPLRGFFPAPTEASFLCQAADPLPSELREPGRTLRKSRSWQGKAATWSADWKKPYNEWHG